jgi:hypothetical protein
VDKGATLGAGFIANITIPTAASTKATNRDAMKAFLIIFMIQMFDIRSSGLTKKLSHRLGAEPIKLRMGLMNPRCYKPQRHRRLAGAKF